MSTGRNSANFIIKAPIMILRCIGLNLTTYLFGWNQGEFNVGSTLKSHSNSPRFWPNKRAITVGKNITHSVQCKAKNLTLKGRKCSTNSQGSVHMGHRYLEPNI